MMERTVLCSSFFFLSFLSFFAMYKMSFKMKLEAATQTASPAITVFGGKYFRQHRRCFSPTVLKSRLTNAFPRLYPMTSVLHQPSTLCILSFFLLHILQSKLSTFKFSFQVEAQCTTHANIQSTFIEISKEICHKTLYACLVKWKLGKYVQRTRCLEKEGPFVLYGICSGTFIISKIFMYSNFSFS